MVASFTCVLLLLPSAILASSPRELAVQTCAETDSECMSTSGDIMLQAKFGKSVTASVYESETNAEAIPKIVHFMYKDVLATGNWTNPVWRESFHAWKKYFPEPEYSYTFWTDASMGVFFRTHCPEHVSLYESYTRINIISCADLARYCILKEQGGIYSDLDYEPRANFYEELNPARVNLIESAYHNEIFQNSLMASPVGLSYGGYWKGVLDLAELLSSNDPVQATGPKLLDHYAGSLNLGLVHTLPCSKFQRRIHGESVLPKQGCGDLSAANLDGVLGIHWGTWSWIDLSSGKGQDKNADTQRLFHALHPGAD